MMMTSQVRSGIDFTPAGWTGSSGAAGAEYGLARTSRAGSG